MSKNSLQITKINVDIDMNKISKVYLPSIFTEIGEYYILGIESDNKSIVNMSNVIYTAEFVLKESVIDVLKIDKYKIKIF